MSTSIPYDDYLEGGACLTCYDADWLLDQGYDARGVAARMGRSRDGLARHLRRCTPTVAERFARANPVVTYQRMGAPA